MATTILVPDDLAAKVKALVEAERIPLQIVQQGEADLRVERREGRVESTDPTLQAGGWIRCPVARDIAVRLGIDTKQFGKLLNAFDIKVRDCELGCF